MTIICISSGIIALSGEGVGYDLQAMLKLPFIITKQMILSISLIGGVVLVFLEILLTKYIMEKILKKDF